MIDDYANYRIRNSEIDHNICRIPYQLWEKILKSPKYQYFPDDDIEQR